VTERQADGPDLGQMLGMGGDDVRARLGDPESEGTIGRDTWLVYSEGNTRIRLRLSPRTADADPTLRSWTCELSGLVHDLPSVAEGLRIRLGGPVDSPPEAEGRLLRCEVVGELTKASLTATLREGRIASVTVFDEAPDWLPEDTR